MITLTEFKSGSSFAGLMEKLFEARDYAHNCHLHTNSFAKHKALGSFYETIVDLADQLYEVHTGQYGHVNFSTGSSKEKNEIVYFEDLGMICKEAHRVFDDKDTHLHNILDEITATVYHLIYKLKYLK